MRRGVAFLCGICSLLVFGIVIYFRSDIIDVAEFFKALGDDRKVMDSAKKYMDSLTDKDIQTWIQRAQADLEKDNPTDFTGRDAPPDLQKLGMTGIEENSNYIDYMWLGGMDYTALEVERMSNGDFQVTAIYTPYTNRVIWPRQAP